MKILVVGANGMIGSSLLRAWRDRHEVRGTIRGPSSDPAVFGGIDICRVGAVERTMDVFRPDVVVNAAGIVKQRTAPDAEFMEANAIFPRRLATHCNLRGVRLVLLSSDCVFSGLKGGYTESDPPDPVDIYGFSRADGEISCLGVLTLRTSVIGLEQTRFLGLVEWFLRQRGTVRGFRQAIYSGLTTGAVAPEILRLLEDFPKLWGIRHLASDPIDKHALLTRLSALLGRTDIHIEPDDSLVCDRSLDASLLGVETGYVAPPWDYMLEGLAGEIRRRGADVHA